MPSDSSGVEPQEQDQRRRVNDSLEALDQRCDVHISSLDHALNVISNIGVLYRQMRFSSCKELLRLTVKRVIINRECEVVDVELLPPFAYLSDLGDAVCSSRDGGDLGANKNPPCGGL